MLYAICGPSESGKSTILNEILKVRPQLKRLITLTTRSPRVNELEAIDYYFMSKDLFQEMNKMGQIVYPIIYRNEYYGIRKSDLLACIETDTLSVLRPDGIRPISKYVPITGIYVEMDINEHIYNSHDKEVYDNKHICSYYIKNIYGNLNYAVEKVLSIVDQSK